MSGEIPFNPETLKGPEKITVEHLLKRYDASDLPGLIRRDSEQLKFALKGDDVRTICTVRTFLPPIPISNPKGLEREEENTVVPAQIDTVYNPSNIINGQIAGRVEPLNSEVSRVSCFSLENGIYVPNSDAPIFPYSQDPACMQVKDGIVFTVVHIDVSKDSKIESWHKVESWHQEFYYSRSGFENIDTDNPIAIGPEKMKDIRLVQWPDGKIGIFSRPQGGAGGRGKIGYIETDTLSEIESAIPQAEIIPNVFIDEEWGGVNDVMILSKNEAGLIMHIARFNPVTGKKDYYPSTAIFHRDSQTITNLEIIARANDLPFPVTPKKDDLGEVMFTGGATKKSEGEIGITLGVGDRVGYQIPTIPVPSFMRYIH